VIGRGWRLVAAAATAAATLTGCNLSQGLYGVTLPGSVGAGGYKVTAIFPDAAQLVPDSTVKVADVTVGTVTGVSLIRRHDQWMARIVMHIEPSVHVPSNSVATLQQTSLLGEDFVELGPPPGQTAASTQLPENGKAYLAANNTIEYPDLEQVFGALSLLLNDGGLPELQTIDYELSQALNGREANVRDLIRQLNITLGGLNSQRGEIVRALDNLDALSTVLVRQRDTIATALTDLAPGLKVMADERSQFVALLSSLSRLGRVATRIVDASVTSTQADFAELRPVVERIAAAGAALPRSLDLLLDYPFPLDSAGSMPGDFANLYATLLLNQSGLCQLLGIPPQDCPSNLKLPGPVSPSHSSGHPGSGRTTHRGSPSPGSGLGKKVRHLLHHLKPSPGSGLGGLLHHLLGGPGGLLDFGYSGASAAALSGYGAMAQLLMMEPSS
jgi:phospholipid/cholesterol/gamma-HCH transport system substrate-binding protein